MTFFAKSDSVPQLTYAIFIFTLAQFLRVNMRARTAVSQRTHFTHTTPLHSVNNFQDSQH